MRAGPEDAPFRRSYNMTPTTFCLLLCAVGGAQGASIVLSRPKGNSRPRPPPPPPRPPTPPPSFAPELGSGFGIEDPILGVADRGWLPPDPCSYETLISDMMLRTSERFQMARPVKNYTDSLQIYLEVVLYAILDVKETDQTCVTCVWTFMSWINENIMWDPDKYCGMDKITVPADTLWKPDIIIEEVTEKDKASVAPFLSVYSDGLVELLSDRVVTSSCKMHVYRFPFDTQSCNLTFKSAIHSVDELRLTAVMDPEKVSAWTREKMRTQFEWLFVGMNVTNDTTSNFETEQDVIIYTINMRRRSVLYIVNFLFPVMFFLLLDLASFLMSDTGGEKLGFKITLLLAVTVMQLLLNDILPSSSNRIPLIAVYCIGIFSLMFLSLLESILVLYLLNKDSESSEEEPVEAQPAKNKSLPTSSHFLPDKKSSLMEEVSLESVAAELKDVKESLSLIVRNGKEEEEPSRYWARKTKSINRFFFVFYVFAAFVFLLFLFLVWVH